jgi:hypothetical protein
MKLLLSYKEGKLTLQKAMMSQTDVLSTQRAGPVNPGKETLYPLCRTENLFPTGLSSPFFPTSSTYEIIYYVLGGFNTF